MELQPLLRKLTLSSLRMKVRLRKTSLNYLFT